MRKLSILLFICLLLLCACNTNTATPIAIDTSLAPKPATSIPAPAQSTTPLVPDKKPPYRIACIFPRNDTPEWQLTYQSCATAIEALSSLNVTGYCAFPSTPNNTQEQIALIEAAIKDGVDGILLAPTSATEIGEYITQNFTKRSPFVMSLGQEIITKSPYVVAHIGTDMYDAGKDMAKLAVEALGGTGTYAVIGNEVANSIEVSRGIKDYLTTLGNFSVLTDTIQSTSLDVALSYIEELDTTSLHGKAVLFITDPSFIVPIAQKAAASKNKNALCIIGYGISAEVLSLVESGNIYGTIGENNYLLGFDAPFYMIDFFEAKQTKALIPIAHTVLTKELLADAIVQDYLQSIGLA